ncbi:MAG: HBL/NHE enterotoxin family protein [Methanothrix sp.]
MSNEDDMALSPDVIKTKLSVNASLSAVTQVSIYSQSLISAVPAFPEPIPDWIAPAKDHITKAQENAENWLNNICTDTVKTVPQAIVDFNHSFQENVECLLDAIDKSDAKRATTILEALSGEISRQHSHLFLVQKNLLSFYDDLSQQVRYLDEDISLIDKHIKSGSEMVKEIQVTFSDVFIRSQALDPCNIIVDIDERILITTIGMTKGNPAIIPLVLTEILFKQLLQQGQDEAIVFSNVLNIWETLQLKYSSVIRRLKDAEAEKVSSILKTLDIQTAKKGWAELADFASKMGCCTI